MRAKTKTIAKLLMRLMKDTGLRAGKLAAAAGIQESQISFALAGKRTPTLETIGKILRGVGKDWSYLHDNFQLPK